MNTTLTRSLASAAAANASTPMAMPAATPARMLRGNSASLGYVQLGPSYADNPLSAKDPCPARSDRRCHRGEGSVDPRPGMGMSKSRLDQLMVERGLAESRAKAQALVLAGQVWSGERRLDKPGQSVAPDLPLEVRAPAVPYVSRGGLKLAHGLDHFGIDPAGLVALDVGASTGGFTDVLLQRGARRVYAVDVGHGQLDWRLRNDPR